MKRRERERERERERTTLYILFFLSVYHREEGGTKMMNTRCEQKKKLFLTDINLRVVLNKK